MRQENGDRLSIYFPVLRFIVEREAQNGKRRLVAALREPRRRKEGEAGPSHARSYAHPSVGSEINPRSDSGSSPEDFKASLAPLGATNRKQNKIPPRVEENEKLRRGCWVCRGRWRRWSRAISRVSCPLHASDCERVTFRRQRACLRGS